MKHVESEIFRALADPTRRAIFERLAHGETSVSDLVERFDVSQPAVSQHLSALKKAGLVAQRRDGRRVYYRAEPSGLRPLVDWLTHYQVFWRERLKKLEALLEEMEE